MYLRNHGVPQSLVDLVFTQSRAFFALAPEVKAKAKPKEKASTRGYEGVGVQALEEGRPGDLKKSFNAAPSRRGFGPTPGPRAGRNFNRHCCRFSTPPRRVATN